MEVHAHHTEMSLYEIVVWNGVVATYGSIKHFILEGDLVTKATDEEKRKYLELQRKGK